MFNRAFCKIREGAGVVTGKGRAPRERGRPARILFLPMLPPPPSGLHPRAGAVAAYAARLSRQPFPMGLRCRSQGDVAFFAERGGPKEPPASPARRSAAAASPLDSNPGCIDVQKMSVPRRRCRSIQVAEMGGAVPGMVRAERPRSRGASSLDVVAPKEVHRYSCLFVFIRGSSLKTIASFFLE